MGAQNRRFAGVFENAKVDRLFVRLDTPGDSVVGADINPTYKVRLEILVELESLTVTSPTLL